VVDEETYSRPPSVLAVVLLLMTLGALQQGGILPECLPDWTRGEPGASSFLIQSRWHARRIFEPAGCCGTDLFHCAWPRDLLP